MRTVSFTDRLHYWFDNLMARGTVALIALLGLLALILIFIVSLIVSFLHIAPEGVAGDEMDFFEIMWRSLLRTLDAGTMGGDTGSPPFLFFMFVVTLGGVFIVSILIGVITSGIEQRLDRLRRGRSIVLEQGHTLILGWSPQIFSIISELLIANANKRNGRIVILAERDLLEMNEEIHARIPHTGRTRIITRSGNPLEMSDLAIVNPNGSRAIIILSPQGEDADMHIIKTILAIVNHPQRRPEPYHIVAQVREPQNLAAAQLVARDEARLLLEKDLISRLTVQTCRQSGLSVVYTELMNFEGDEFYFASEPSLVGKTFGDALLAFEDSSIVGLRRQGERPKLNPPMDTRIEAGDMLLAISEDDDTVKISGLRDLQIDEGAIVNERWEAHAPERTLILGWNRRGLSILRELDNYVSSNSEALIVAHMPATRINAEEQIAQVAASLQHLRVTFRAGDSAERQLLDGLAIPTYQHVIVLSYADMLDTQEADAKTLITLLHLRDIRERSEQKFSIVSEMLDLRNRQLAEVTQADDFIVSDHLLSLMLAQVSENRFLHDVYSDLFSSEGSEIYLKPAEHYVRLNHEVNFYTIVESARRRGETAIGYRLRRDANDASKAYGVVVNPDKSKRLSFAPGDKLILVAEE